MNKKDNRKSVFIRGLLLQGIFLLGLLFVGCSADTPPVPEGFSHQEGTVQEGFVIADDVGNEFVWIPAQELNRYDFKAGEPVEGDDPIDHFFYGEGREESVIYGAEAGLTSFQKSVGKHGGFYISRYEAGEGMTSRPDMEPAAMITRDEALKACANAHFSEDTISTLPSSYAYDTMLRFAIGEEMIHREESGEPAEEAHRTGGDEMDRIANIYDLKGNLSEWTTEYSSNAFYSYKEDCVCRGTTYADASSDPTLRKCNGNVANPYTGFRVLLYFR